ncbi:DUF3017 domain-containing protein [Nocardioides cavernaquae]|uniref:DUF3017 domain-containing protein n=1 Tax=Nocardioides cavernaquae TaxID=2321396 RepID=A0A3A5H769_9ACTN|nr:DUF3017 domain-containing protein [Nocardioides cavernaquae]RJS46519.1 DUF3017 domain-containing protein [Nocardioides cavernaquae]
MVDDAEQPVEPVDPELGETELGETEPGEVDEREHALLEGRAPLPPLRDVARLKQPSTLGGAIYLVVLVLAIVGVVIAATGAWRQGVSWLGASMIAAAVSRVILPEENAGMLHVRPKLLDVLTLAGAGGLLLFLAATIPNQPH